MPQSTGYSRASIVIHWLAAILIVALFFTHEANRGSMGYMFHVSIGALLGLFLLWRVARRVMRGMTQKPQQAFIYNLASQIVITGLLVAIVAVVISGYLLPWSQGQPLDIAGLFAIPSPMSANHNFHEIVEEVHEISGKLFIPLLLLHILGTLKHAFIDRDNIAQRMFRSIAGGR